MVHCITGIAICPIDMMSVEAGLQSSGGWKETIPRHRGQRATPPYIDFWFLSRPSRRKTIFLPWASLRH